MDRKTSEKTEVEHLIRASQAARACLETEFSRIRHQLDVPSRIKTSLKTHPLQWLAGSVFSGFIARLFFARRKVVIKSNSRGISRALFGLGLSAATPFAKIWLANQLSQWIKPSSNHTRSAADHYPPL